MKRVTQRQVKAARVFLLYLQPKTLAGEGRSGIKAATEKCKSTWRSAS